MQDMRIVFDTTEAEAQMEELSKLLKTVKHLPDDIVSNLSGLAFDILVTDRGSALSADGILEHRLLVRFGGRFHNIMAALRAGKINDIAHEIAPLRDYKL
jgi:hypothetical protein